MEYTVFYEAKATKRRNFDIIYGVFKNEDSFGIESFIGGGDFYEKASFGFCGEKEAEKIAKIFAKKGVHPVHIEDIISDMMY